MDFIGSFINKKDNTPIYYQLYKYLTDEIRAGRIAAGEKLPGKRTAAAQLGVSVNTVDEAYQMLNAEGYVQARPRSGFVVNKLHQMLPPPPPETAAVRAPRAGEDGRGGPAAGGGLPPGAAAPPFAPAYSFLSGGLDPSLFPRKTWNRLFKEVLAGEDGLFSRGEGMGDAVLRRAIAAYLRGYRGVRCGEDQLVVGAGLEVLTGMLARLLDGEVFALEDPGYPKAAHILHNSGLKTRAVPVDAEGMRPDALVQSGATAAYLTPSHQFPTGCVMPVGRRTQLLRWAEGRQGWIVEDDYDSEFRFDGRPLPSLQGLDEAQRVVYAGTFSRSLAPGLRAAYLVLPPALLARWRSAYGDYACTVSRPEQHTLARLMEEGHFARSLNRVRVAYRRRRDLLLEELAAALPAGSWQAENTHTGLYFILRVPGQNAAALAQGLRGKGLAVRAMGEYRLPAEAAEGGRAPGSQGLPHQGSKKAADDDCLVLGYGGLPEEKTEGAVALLAAGLAGPG